MAGRNEAGYVEPAIWAVRLSSNRHKRILGMVAALSHGLGVENATPSIVLIGPSLWLARMPFSP